MADDVRPAILLIEDDPSLASALKGAIEKKGFVVTLARNGSEGIEAVRSRAFSVLIVDLMLPDQTGADVIEAARTELVDHHTPVIVITGAEASALARIDRTIVKTVLFKPLDLDQFAAYVHITSMSRPAAGR